MGSESAQCLWFGSEEEKPFHLTWQFLISSALLGYNQGLPLSSALCSPRHHHCYEGKTEESNSQGLVKNLK